MNNTLRFLALSLLLSVNLNAAEVAAEVAPEVAVAAEVTSVNTSAEISRIMQGWRTWASEAAQQTSENARSFYNKNFVAAQEVVQEVAQDVVADVTPEVQTTRMQQIVAFVKNNTEKVVTFAKENKVKTTVGTAAVVVGVYALYKWKKSARKSVLTREQEEAAVDAITA